MTDRSDHPASGVAPRADSLTLMAFVALVVIGGSNAVAVRFSNLELPPFWGAASRFLTAAAVFWIILIASRTNLPKGKALVGSVLYGVLVVGASYAFLYWGLLKLQAGMTMVILALGPLMTMFFAVAHGLERFRWMGLAGALIALAGIVLAVGPGIGGSAPLPSLLAVLLGAACVAEGSVVYKLFPGTAPLPTNVVATTTGGILLVLISLVAGESWSLPAAPATIGAFTYLVLIGTVFLFYIYLIVLSRWTASATSYAFLLFPIATVIVAALLASERISVPFVIGGAFVLLGVWIGALRTPPAAPAGEEVVSPVVERPQPPLPGCP